jgi:hypothetical protein
VLALGAIYVIIAVKYSAKCLETKARNEHSRSVRHRALDTTLRLKVHRVPSCSDDLAAGSVPTVGQAPRRADLPELSGSLRWVIVACAAPRISGQLGADSGAPCTVSRLRDFSVRQAYPPGGARSRIRGQAALYSAAARLGKTQSERG